MARIKTFIYTFIIAVYLVNNTGIPVYYHYCGGELESVNALFKTDGCCGGMEDEEDSGCCQDETRILSQKSETSFSTTSFKLEPAQLHIASIDYSSDLLSDLATENYFKDQFIDFHPPRSGRIVLADKSVLII